MLKNRRTKYYIFQLVQPKFINFIYCTFDTSWKPISIDKLAEELQWTLERMSRFKSLKQEAIVNLTDMTYKEVKIKFNKSSIVGVGNGLFYCDATDVIDTKIIEAPM